MDAYEGMPIGENGKVRFDGGKKFDFQLDLGKKREQYLANIFLNAKLDGAKFELKAESFLWEQKGNICVEYARGETKSGLAATEADFWVHELQRKGETLCWLMFPMARFKDLAGEAYRKGNIVTGGDGRLSRMVLIALKDILQ